MKYEQVIINHMRADSQTLMNELTAQGKTLTMSDLADYDKLFSGDDVLGMISWIESLEEYLNGENDER